MAATKTKASDRAAVIKKLLPAIKKQYKVNIPKGDRPVLETMLFAVCLEDATVDDAERWYARIATEFPDMNEARVSSVNELERIFDQTDTADIRAYRMRGLLQYIFEKSYSFEFEGLRKKTLELAMKQLAKIRHITPFVRAYTLQSTIGAHLLPLDESSSKALVWLGLAAPGQSTDEVGETLKSAVRKAESELFCCSLRCIATDPRILAAFSYPPPDEDGFDAGDSVERLAELWKHGAAALKPKAKPEPKVEPKAKAPAAKAAPAKAVASKAVPAPAAAVKKDKEKPKEAPPSAAKAAPVAAAKAVPAAAKKKAAEPAKAAKPAAKPAKKVVKKARSS